MSFIDKIVNSVKLNDSYDDQEEFLDDEDIEEEEEEEESRRGFVDRWRAKREAKKEQKRAERAAKREAMDEESEDDEPVDEQPTYSFREDTDEQEEEASSETFQKKKSRWKRRDKERGIRDEEDRWGDTENSFAAEDTARYEKSYESPVRPKVTPLRRRKAGKVPMEVKVIRPTSMEDSREIADTLMSECTVLLNLEGIDMDIAQRIIDFTCGTCYSLNGRLQKISNYIFILTPEEVDISGDVISMLGGNFEIPTMSSKY